MSARFVRIDEDTQLLLPPEMRQWVPKDRLVHFLMDAVERDRHGRRVADLEKKEDPPEPEAGARFQDEMAHRAATKAGWQLSKQSTLRVFSPSAQQSSSSPSKRPLDFFGNLPFQFTARGPSPTGC